eukprot:4462299-Lingulodinium_polyedra.AAC.1
MGYGGWGPEIQGRGYRPTCCCRAGRGTRYETCIRTIKGGITFCPPRARETGARKDGGSCPRRPLFAASTLAF